MVLNENELTRVRREVFPEPLGPINRMEGSVVRPDARNTTEWRKRGIEIASRIAMANPRGDGLRRVSAQALMPSIIASPQSTFESETDVLWLLQV